MAQKQLNSDSHKTQPQGALIVLQRETGLGQRAEGGREIPEWAPEGAIDFDTAENW